MHSSDFSASAPGSLIATVDGAPAFIPDPLPVAIPLNPPTIRLLSEAENALGRLAGRAALGVNPYLVGSPLLHREAILSSRIEGTITTPEQLVLLEAVPERDARPGIQVDDDTREVLNYVGAMNLGLERLRELPLCLRVINDVHARLLDGVRGRSASPGEFRRTQNWIGPKGCTIHEARFVPPPVPEMKRALDELEKYIHQEGKEVPVLVEVALVHYQFEAVHPFADGNGRIGRLLIPLMLLARGRMPEPLLYLSAFFERNREAYMDMLLRVSQHGAWNEWIRFFLQAVLECAQEAITQVEGLLELRRRYHARLQTSTQLGPPPEAHRSSFRGAVDNDNASSRASWSDADCCHGQRQKTLRVGYSARIAGAHTKPSVSGARNHRVHSRRVRTASCAEPGVRDQSGGSLVRRLSAILSRLAITSAASRPTRRLCAHRDRLRSGDR
jgi:Fic family protein